MAALVMEESWIGRKDKDTWKVMEPTEFSSNKVHIC